jgi:hypothetical protein
MTRLFTRVRRKSTVRRCLTLRMIPRRWLTLVKSASIWSDHDNVWFKVIPRYLNQLNDSTRFSGLLLIRKFIFCSLASLALLPKTINLHLEVLWVKRLAPNQRDKFYRSELSFCSNSIVVLAEQNRTVSSACREMSQLLTVEGISFTLMRNSKGPSILPRVLRHVLVEWTTVQGQ